MWSSAIKFTLFSVLASLSIAARLPNKYNFIPPSAQPPANSYKTPNVVKPSTTPFTPPVNTYQRPARPTTRRPQQSYTPLPSNDISYKKPKQEPGMPYDFSWGVDDSDSGNKFSHVEKSDGEKTEGQYQVLLPDGRTQVVKFYDDGWGFVAEVTFE